MKNASRISFQSEVKTLCSNTKSFLAFRDTRMKDIYLGIVILFLQSLGSWDKVQFHSSARQMPGTCLPISIFSIVDCTTLEPIAHFPLHKFNVAIQTFLFPKPLPTLMFSSPLNSLQPAGRKACRRHLKVLDCFIRQSKATYTTTKHTIIQ